MQTRYVIDTADWNGEVNGPGRSMPAKARLRNSTRRIAADSPKRNEVKLRRRASRWRRWTPCCLASRHCLTAPDYLRTILTGSLLTSRESKSRLPFWRLKAILRRQRGRREGCNHREKAALRLWAASSGKAIVRVTRRDPLERGSARRSRSRVQRVAAASAESHTIKGRAPAFIRDGAAALSTMAGSPTKRISERKR